MGDKTLALLNEVTNSLADDIEDFSCGELRQALYRAIAQREEAAERIEALEAALRNIQALAKKRQAEGGPDGNLKAIEGFAKQALENSNGR